MNNLRIELASLADESRAILVARYFQTGPGQYAEGDVFWGISNPEVRRVAKLYPDMNRADVEELAPRPNPRMPVRGSASVDTAISQGISGWKTSHF